MKFFLKAFMNFLIGFIKMNEKSMPNSRLLWGNIFCATYVVLTILEKSSNSGAFTMVIVGASLLGLSIAEKVLTGVYSNTTTTTNTSTNTTNIDSKDFKDTVESAGKIIKDIKNKKE